ncbi:hypothetical protein PRZ48_013073 [Zasmidium cellare]|uniref:Uncharacterized protein n=1 Tax=Zasmidium cellare TaxID=395010 RepID=A0ABR0E3F5_ZASCE|nr:hypothetical protein PRZ48_013073 [Zasmidium cellare]
MSRKILSSKTETVFDNAEGEAEDGGDYYSDGASDAESDDDDGDEADNTDLRFDFGDFIQHDPQVYSKEPAVEDSAAGVPTADPGLWKTDHFDLGMRDIPYVEPPNAEDNRARLRAWLSTILRTLTVFTIVSNCFELRQSSWRFSMTQFLGSTVSRNIEKIATILFNAFPAHAQDVLGRQNFTI